MFVLLSVADGVLLSVADEGEWHLTPRLVSAIVTSYKQGHRKEETSVKSNEDNFFFLTCYFAQVIFSSSFGSKAFLEK